MSLLEGAGSTVQNLKILSKSQINCKILIVMFWTNLWIKLRIAILET